MVDIPTIGAIVTATSVIIGVIYYSFTARTTLQTRQAQLLMQIYDRIANRTFARDYAETAWFWSWSDQDDYYKKYGGNLDEFPKFQNIIDTYEGIGIVLQNKLVDPKLIYGVLRAQPILYWEKFSPMMRQWGDQTGESIMYPGFEYLYGEMKRQYRLEHGYDFDYKVRHVRDVGISTK
jgi:hypothetical protein